MAGASKASPDSSALGDFMVAGATAGSIHGQWQNEAYYTLPVMLQIWVSRRGHHRLPETLPVLLPLSHGFAKGCTILSLVRGPQQAGGGPAPGLSRDARWFRCSEPQILKLPWADKELEVFRHDCTSLSLLASCLTFSSPGTAGFPCWRAGSCGWVKMRFRG